MLLAQGGPPATPTPTPLPFPYPTTQMIDIGSSSAFAIGMGQYMRISILTQALILFCLGFTIAVYLYKR